MHDDLKLKYFDYSAITRIRRSFAPPVKRINVRASTTADHVMLMLKTLLESVDPSRKRLYHRSRTLILRLEENVQLGMHLLTTSQRAQDRQGIHYH